MGLEDGVLTLKIVLHCSFLLNHRIALKTSLEKPLSFEGLLLRNGNSGRYKVGHVEICLRAEKDFPGSVSGKESACQCRRHKKCRLDPWVGKIPWRRKRQPTPVFLPGESHGLRSLAGYSLWVTVRHN